jgi:hypothetical protein
MNKKLSRFLQRSGTTPSSAGQGPLYSVRVGRGDQFRNIQKVYTQMLKSGCTDAAIERFLELTRGRQAITAAARAVREMMPGWTYSNGKLLNESGQNPSPD